MKCIITYYSLEFIKTRKYTSEFIESERYERRKKYEREEDLYYSYLISFYIRKTLEFTFPITIYYSYEMGGFTLQT